MIPAQRAHVPDRVTLLPVAAPRPGRATVVTSHARPGRPGHPDRAPAPPFRISHEIAPSEPPGWPGANRCAPAHKPPPRPPTRYKDGLRPTAVQMAARSAVVYSLHRRFSNSPARKAARTTPSRSSAVARSCASPTPRNCHPTIKALSFDQPTPAARVIMILYHCAPPEPAGPPLSPRLTLPGDGQSITSSSGCNQPPAPNVCCSGRRESRGGGGDLHETGCRSPQSE